jgi:ubiquitin C-terminal hydrolase
MKKVEDEKKFEQELRKRVVILLVLCSALVGLLFFYKDIQNVFQNFFVQPIQKLTAEQCEKVGVKILNVSCENKVVRIKVENTGKIDFRTTFLVFTNTDQMQVISGVSTDDILRVGKSSEVKLKLENLIGTINQVSLVVQDCQDKMDVKSDLAIQC